MMKLFGYKLTLPKITVFLLYNFRHHPDVNRISAAITPEIVNISVDRIRFRGHTGLTRANPVIRAFRMISKIVW